MEMLIRSTPVASDAIGIAGACNQVSFDATAPRFYSMLNARAFNGEARHRRYISCFLRDLGASDCYGNTEPQRSRCSALLLHHAGGYIDMLSVVTVHPPAEHPDSSSVSNNTKRIPPPHRDRGRRRSLALMFFLEMPVVFARRIFDVGLYDVSHYTTVIMHHSAARIKVSLTERSVPTRIKWHDIIF
jgi:hypothetical protein